MCLLEVRKKKESDSFNINSSNKLLCSIAVVHITKILMFSLLLVFMLVKICYSILFPKKKVICVTDISTNS